MRTFVRRVARATTGLAMAGAMAVATVPAASAEQAAAAVPPAATTTADLPSPDVVEIVPAAAGPNPIFYPRCDRSGGCWVKMCDVPGRYAHGSRPMLVYRGRHSELFVVGTDARVYHLRCGWKGWGHMGGRVVDFVNAHRYQGLAAIKVVVPGGGHWCSTYIAARWNWSRC
jgi:hypothetical protein